MNKKNTFRLIATICLIIGLMLTVCACDNSGNTETEGKTEAPAVTEVPTVAETEPVTEPVTEPESTAFTIKVVDENGNALEGVFAQICSGDLCLAPYFTDADGIVSIENDLSDYTVKAYLDGYTSEQTEYEFENGSRTIEIVMTKN